MAGRNRTVLSGSSSDSLSGSAKALRYSYLPWVDLICAGVPCQDWSVAGKRAGLSGTRSSLVYQFARILHTLRPTWFLFENVPGLLSSNDGRDFAEVLRLFMVKCGYGIQWRVLDSQFFGVAQRRRRLFIVGRFGKPCPPEILFEPESGAGDFAQGQEAREGVASETCDRIASALRHNDGGCKNGGPRGGYGENLVADIIGPLKGSNREGGYIPNCEEAADGQLICAPIDGTWAKGGSGKSDYPVGLVAAPITASYGKQVDSSDTNGGPPNLVLRRQPGVFKRRGGFGWSEANDISPTLESTAASHQGGSELTPYITSLCGLGSGGPDDNDGQANRIIECPTPNPYGVRSASGLPEGLDQIAQYFEGWLPKGQDSPRYRALGNAVTTKVIEWIGQRISTADSHEQARAVGLGTHPIEPSCGELKVRIEGGGAAPPQEDKK